MSSILRTKKIALVDCNSFYVSCERLFNPKIRRKPVVVLSNNDGCIISRSTEAKALGIKMGEPYFKAKDIIIKNKVEQNKNMKLTIPYYLHKAGAGFPSPATDYIEEDIDLNMHLIRNVPATFIIRVQGKSMVDVGINDGDLLVVDKSLKPKNFSTVIANVHDELVVKSLVQERDRKFLTSGSKEFTDRILINEEQDIFIWGVVTYVIHSTY